MPPLYRVTVRFSSGVGFKGCWAWVENLLLFWVSFGAVVDQPFGCDGPTVWRRFGLDFAPGFLDGCLSDMAYNIVD